MPGHNGETRETHHTAYLHDVREELDALIGGIVDTTHECAPIRPGEQWTVPFTASCGYAGEIVIRVFEAGDCEPVRAPFSNGQQRNRLVRVLKAFRPRIAQLLGESF